MKDNKPGAPPENPKPVNTNPSISFSYQDLILQEVVFVNNETVLVFMLNGEYLVQIEQFEYFGWLNFIFNEIGIIQEEDPAACICDICTTTYELFDDTAEVTKIEIDGKTDEIISEKKGTLKIIYPYDLTNNTKVGYHTAEEHKK